MSLTLRDHVQRMAEYNTWMNERIYEAAAKLPAAEFTRDRGAFFGSLSGTLNHLCVGDTIWLQRFAEHPARHAALDPIRALPTPTALNQILFAELPALRAHRKLIDAALMVWVAQLTDDDLQHPLLYANTKGVRFCRSLAKLLMHFFNHQTHHRGQATTLLFQAGVDPGATDLLGLIPEDAEVD